MTTFLLDQNVNKKSLAETCNREGFAHVRRFPSEWKMQAGGFKDPDLLQKVMVGNQPLLTNDRNIAREHATIIPPINPGIIIVGFCKGTIKPLGKGDIERILRQFKQSFPQWHVTTWNNSIVEITQKHAEVWHVETGDLRSDDYISFDELNWSGRLAGVLEKNAARRPPSIADHTHRPNDNRSD